jgi:hypothetical protein
MSILYRYLAAFVAPLQSPFDSYNTYRSKEALIASCKWQIGQLTNVLNYLYDSIFNRIYISQSVIATNTDPMFQYPPYNFDKVFAEDPVIFERSFGDKVASSLVTINVPNIVNQSDLAATVEQIRMQGIPYRIAIFFV